VMVLVVGIVMHGVWCVLCGVCCVMLDVLFMCDVER
jgi:hypothetical protein